MGTFVIERAIDAPPPSVWGVITDWAGYARWIPLTRMHLDRGPTGVGWSFAGLTGIGRFRFADTMVITDWAPPVGEGLGAFRLVKVGRQLAGWAEVSVLPAANGEQTLLIWRENIVIRPVVLGRLLAPLTDRVNRALFASVVDKMAAEAVLGSGQR
ncbi:MAG: SRPBCC family protein [Dermatophilaceae bacterium]